MALWRSKKPVDSDETTQPSEPEVKPADNDERADQEKGSGGLFTKMRGALTKTRQALNTDIRDLFKSEGRLVDDEFLADLFSRLVRTDMGVGPDMLRYQGLISEHV